MKAHELTQDLLKAHIEYDPDTGLFRRLRRLHRRPAVRPSLKAEKWHAGCPNNCGHLRVWVLGNIHQAHRLAWLYMTGAWPTREIDHINCIQSDNRFENLRDVTHSVNNQNRKEAIKTKKSCKLLGAYRSGQRWMAMIMLNRKQTYLGAFDTAEEAHAAYVGAKRVMHPGCTI